MPYEINVAKKNEQGRYSHYFATAERSLTTEEQTREVYEQFVQLFPAPEYQITVSLWQHCGNELEDCDWYRPSWARKEPFPLRDLGGELVTDPWWQDFGEVDELMTYEAFVEEVEHNILIDYDGLGFLANEDGVSSIVIFPSYLKRYDMRSKPDWATHVVWCNLPEALRHALEA